jgi:hypothetical protein
MMRATKEWDTTRPFSANLNQVRPHAECITLYLLWGQHVALQVYKPLHLLWGQHVALQVYNPLHLLWGQHVALQVYKPLHLLWGQHVALQVCKPNITSVVGATFGTTSL